MHCACYLHGLPCLALDAMLCFAVPVFMAKAGEVRRKLSLWRWMVGRSVQLAHAAVFCRASRRRSRW